MKAAAAKKPTEKATRKPHPRGRGRPVAQHNFGVSADSIKLAAYQLSFTVPLSDLSVVVVAKHMNITPSLVHYHVGGRDRLTSGVMNLFYRDLVLKWPNPSGRWDTDIAAGARAIYQHFATNGGIVSYCMTNSRFRVYQLTEDGEPDYGVQCLELLTARIRDAGLSPERTSAYSHMFAQFTLSSAQGAASVAYPGSHHEYLEEKMNDIDAKQFPAIAYARQWTHPLNPDEAFEEGCNLLLLGIERDRAKAQQRKKTGKVAARR